MSDKLHVGLLHYAYKSAVLDLLPTYCSIVVIFFHESTVVIIKHETQSCAQELVQLGICQENPLVAPVW